MPIYEYKCKECDHKFEAFQKITDDPIKECPECGSDVRKLISKVSGIIFKGSGFYVTDYKKSNVKSGHATSEKSSKTESDKSIAKNSKKEQTHEKTPAVKSGEN